MIFSGKPKIWAAGIVGGESESFASWQQSSQRPTHKSTSHQHHINNSSSLLLTMMPWGWPLSAAATSSSSSPCCSSPWALSGISPRQASLLSTLWWASVSTFNKGVESLAQDATLPCTQQRITHRWSCLKIPAIAVLVIGLEGPWGPHRYHDYHDWACYWLMKQILHQIC